MKIESGRYIVETWSEHGIDFKQYRLACVVLDGTYSWLKTTAIKMQMDGNKAYAIRIEGMVRYMDSFGDERQAFLEDKILKSFKAFVARNRKKIEKSGGDSYNLDMGQQVELFVEYQLDFTKHDTWKSAYVMADSDSHEGNMKGGFKMSLEDAQGLKAGDSILYGIQDIGLTKMEVIGLTADNYILCWKTDRTGGYKCHLDFSYLVV